MKKTVMVLCASAVLMGRGAGGVEFLGSVFVDPDKTGAVEGVAELTQVDSAVGGFV